MISFIHSSDWQMGMKRWYLQSDQNTFDQDRLDAVRNVIAEAERNNCDFIVVAGDIFEENDPTERVYQQVLKILAKSRLPIYLLPGNHDYLTPGSVLDRIRKEENPNLIVLDSTEPRELRPGVEIIGTPLLGRDSDRDLLSELLDTLGPNPGTRIIVTHGQFDARGAEKNSVFDLAKAEAAIASGLVNYIAVGDTHSFSKISEGIYFSGAPEVTDFHDIKTDGGERDSGVAALVRIDDSAAPVVEKIRTGRWRFDLYTWDLNAGDSIESIRTQLDDYDDEGRTVIKFGVNGRVRMEELKEFGTMVEHYKETFCNVFERKHNTGLKLEPSEKDLEDLQFSGFIKDTVEELYANDDTEALKELFYIVDDLKESK
ncbi:MAG: metallophosphoesterase [Corynebacterium sp.]|nr:metallophosphoesterase [Corynebacterium sp.]